MAIEYILLEGTGKLLLEDGTSGVLLESSFPEPRPIRINTSQGWADIADATSFVSGTGTPTATVGATGAVYLDTATGLLYGPKAGGAWPGSPITVPAGTVADATTSAKGIVQLAGDLAGTAASPQIAAGVIVDTDVAAANKDGTAATPSLRTLGTGGQQAAAGNDSRFLKAAVSYGTTLPGSPVDGQEAILVDSTTAPSWQWRFRYNASGGTYKWEFLGGPPASFSWSGGSVLNTLFQIGSSGFWVPNVTGAFAVTPRAGDYLINGTALFDSGGTATYILVVPFTGSTVAPSLVRGSSYFASTGFYASTGFTDVIWGGVAAGASLGAAVSSGAAGTTKLAFLNGTIWPARVS